MTCYPYQKDGEMMYSYRVAGDWADSCRREPGSPGTAGRTETNTDPGRCGVAKTVTFDVPSTKQLIVALDFDSLSSAVKVAKQVRSVGLFKIVDQLCLRRPAPLE